MKKIKMKSMFVGAALILTGLFNFTSSNAKGAFLLLEDEYKTFNNCWGSGASDASCTNGNAIVYGCQPETDSYCVGKLRDQS